MSQELKAQPVERVPGCLEATNIYGHALASYLHQQGQDVSIVHPARIKGGVKSQLSRTQNDRADAAVIARFCRDLKPNLWHPAPEAVAQLQTLGRRLGALEPIDNAGKEPAQVMHG